MIETIHQGLQADGITVSISKLCRWFENPRRTVYYRPVQATPKLHEQLVTPIKAMIEENPSFGYRTVAHLLGFNKNTVPAQGLAGAETASGLQTTDPVAALGGQGAQ